MMLLRLRLLLFAVTAMAVAAMEELASTHELLRKLDTEGVVRLPSGLPLEYTNMFAKAAKEHFARVRFHAQQRFGDFVPQNKYESNDVLCYQDITQREPGKYEVKLDAIGGDDASVWSYVNTTHLASTAWGPLVQAALGDDAELHSASIIYSTPRSLLGELAQDQQWHADGSFTCHNCDDPGRYAMVVYIPLEDVEETGGGTVEYLPTTHTDIDLFDAPHDALVQTGQLSVYTPRMLARDVILWDFRLTHRGLARRIDDDSCRPVLKLDYFRKGSADYDNVFCDTRLVPSQDEDGQKVDAGDASHGNEL